MTAMNRLSDEQLLARASHAGRNLIALAILATLCSIVIIVAEIGQVLSPRSATESLPIVSILTILWTVGLWMLATAARRGNPTAVGFVMVVASAMLLISVASLVLVAVRDIQRAQLMWWQPLIPLLVLLVLARSRDVLRELKTRGLWEGRFGSARPSRNLCVAGGVLFVVGYAGFFLSLLLPAIFVAKDAAQSHAFLKAVTAEEKAFMNAMRSLSGPDKPAALENVRQTLDAFARMVASWKSTTSPNSPLFPIIRKYGDAVRAWQDGLAELSASSPNVEEAKERLTLGDKLREEAAAEFNRRYAPPKK
jgi:hypothetical protein